MPSMDKTVSVSDGFKGSPFEQFAVPFTICPLNAEQAHQARIPKLQTLGLALVLGDQAAT